MPLIGALPQPVTSAPLVILLYVVLTLMIVSALTSVLVRDTLWAIGAVSSSMVLIAVLYLALARVARLRAADWLIVGYVVALVGVTGLVMAVEGMQFLRDHVPSHLGVTVATLARPRAAG